MNLIQTNNWLPSLLEDIFNGDLTQDKNGTTIGKQTPAVNIIEHNDSFIVEVAAPGLKKEDFEIELDHNLLTVSTELENETENTNDKYTRREFNYQSFKRSFTLPKSVNVAKIGANYVDGVLRLELPKKEEAKVQPKRLIEIA